MGEGSAALTSTLSRMPLWAEGVTNRLPPLPAVLGNMFSSMSHMWSDLP